MEKDLKGQFLQIPERKCESYTKNYKVKVKPKFKIVAKETR